MNYPTLIQKSCSWLIVLSIVAVHACTLSCSLGFYSCGSDMKVNKASGSPSCCSGKSEGEKDSKNCQEEHLAFFHTFGQSAVSKVVKDADLFPPTVAEFQQQILQPVALQHNAFVTYSNFHPPPSDGDILLLISRFLI